MYNRKRSRIGTVYNNVAFKRGIRFIILYLKTGSKIYIYVSAIYVVFFLKKINHRTSERKRILIFFIAKKMKGSFDVNIQEIFEQ